MRHGGGVPCSVWLAYASSYNCSSYNCSSCPLRPQFAYFLMTPSPTLLFPPLPPIPPIPAKGIGPGAGLLRISASRVSHYVLTEMGHSAGFLIHLSYQLSCARVSVCARVSMLLCVLCVCVSMCAVERLSESGESGWKLPRVSARAEHTGAAAGEREGDKVVLQQVRERERETEWCCSR